MKIYMVDWDNKNAYNLAEDNEYENFWNEVYKRLEATTDIDDLIDLFVSECFDNDVVAMCEKIEINPADWRNDLLETEVWQDFYDDVIVINFINDTYEQFCFDDSENVFIDFDNQCVGA